MNGNGIASGDARATDGHTGPPLQGGLDAILAANHYAALARMDGLCREYSEEMPGQWDVTIGGVSLGKCTVTMHGRDRRG